MTRKLFKANHLFLLLALVSLLFASCSKKDDPAPVLSSKEISLTYNAAEVGKVLINEKADGTASLKITLNPAGVIPGASLSAAIISVVGGVEAGLYASLTTFGPGADVSLTNPVLNATPPNAAIPYNTLVGKTGYLIKVTVNQTIQYIASL